MAFPMILPSLRAIKQFVLALAGMLLATQLASADPMTDSSGSLKVTIDRAQVVRIERSADTVIIGNPSIVDATIQDARTIVLTGRSYGVTNMIVLDEDGEPVMDETVVVQNHETNTVRIYRRALRETLACSPICEPTLTIGDTEEVFAKSGQQIQTRNELSKAASE